MSLPIYLYPYKNELIERLSSLGCNDKSIGIIIENLKGRKRQEEMIAYLKLLKEKKLNDGILIEKSEEIKRLYNVNYGYVIDENGDEIYIGDLE